MNLFALSSTKVIVSAVAGAAVATSLVLAPMAFAHKDDEVKNKSSIKATLGMSKVDVSVNHNGKVHVKGATVTAVNGSTITATTQWGAPMLTWTLTTNASTTKFTAEGTGKTTIATIAVGDKLSFEGKLATSTSGFVVAAKAVKELK